MALDGEAFAISAVVNFCVMLVCFISFNFLRVNKFSRKYYAPKRILTIPERSMPKRLPNGFISWMRPLLFGYKEQELMECAGMDAVVTFRLLNFGLWLFLILTILCNATILPTNLSGNFIDKIEQGEVEGASFQRHSDQNTTTQQVEGVASDFTGCEVDDEISGTYTNIDRTSLTNVQRGNDKMWVHLVMVYVVSIVVYHMLTKYHKEAVTLRLEYLSRLKRGAESHTVFVTDIPGIQSGTQLDRAYQLINSTAGRFIPTRWKEKIEQAVAATADRTVVTFQRAIVGRSADEEQKGEGGSEVDESMYKSVKAISGTSAKNFELGEPSSPPPQNHNKIETKQLGSPTVGEITVMNPWRHVEQKLQNGMNIRDVVFYEFEEVYPNLVENAFPVYNQYKLWGLYLTYSKVKQNAEDIVDELTSKVRRRKKFKRPQIQVIPSMYGSWCVEKYKDKNDPTGIKPVKVDKLTFWMQYLPHLKKEIDVEKQIALKNYTSAAFVTFKSRPAQVVSATSLHHHDETCWRTQAAPAPQDLVWENLKLRLWEKSYRMLVSWCVFVLLMMFYAIPVGAIQAFIDRLLNPDKIGNQFVRSLLAGLLPGLALKIFLILVPIILSFLNYKEGMIAHSLVDFGVVRKYFFFQVLVVYLYTIGFSSLWQELECIRNDPEQIVDKLASGVPQNATYFMTYIMLLGFAAKPIAFLRIPGLVIYWILSKLAATERAKNRLWQEQYMHYGPEIPEHTITILIGLCFCCVQPLITPICLLYFISLTVISRYQLLYVYRERYQSGGLMWSTCFDQILIGLVIMQLTMLGLLGIKKFPYAALLVPLIIYNLFYWTTMNNLYKRPLTVMSLRAAADIDAHDREVGGPIDDTYNREVMQMYLSPCFKISDEDHDKLMDEISKCDEKCNSADKRRESLNIDVGEDQMTILNKEDGKV